MAKLISTTDMRRKPVIQGVGLRSPLWVRDGEVEQQGGDFSAAVAGLTGNGATLPRRRFDPIRNP